MSASRVDIQQVHFRLRRDYKYLKVNVIPRLERLYNDRRKNNHVSERSFYSRMYPVKSATGNNWLLFLQKSQLVKRYIDQKSIAILAVTYHYCEKGINAFYLDEKGRIVGFNAHFFDRYNERMNLNLQHPLDIVKAFFKGGALCLRGTIGRGERKQPIALRTDGFQLGEYHIKDGYMEWRTFISKDIARPGQQRIAGKLMNQHQANLNKVLSS